MGEWATYRLDVLSLVASEGLARNELSRGESVRMSGLGCPSWVVLEDGVLLGLGGVGRVCGGSCVVGHCCRCRVGV